MLIIMVSSLVVPLSNKLVIFYNYAVISLTKPDLRDDFDYVLRHDVDRNISFRHANRDAVHAHRVWHDGL